MPLAALYRSFLTVYAWWLAWCNIIKGLTIPWLTGMRGRRIRLLRGIPGTGFSWSLLPNAFNVLELKSIFTTQCCHPCTIWDFGRINDNVPHHLIINHCDVIYLHYVHMRFRVGGHVDVHVDTCIGLHINYECLLEWGTTSTASLNQLYSKSWWYNACVFTLLWCCSNVDHRLLEGQWWPKVQIRCIVA